jgi:hypothetical protein
VLMGAIISLTIACDAHCYLISSQGSFASAESKSYRSRMTPVSSPSAKGPLKKLSMRVR